MSATKDRVEICQVCWRTDAFYPGVIDHDPEWHGFREDMEEWEKEQRGVRREKPKLTFLSLKNI